MVSKGRRWCYGDETVRQCVPDLGGGNRKSSGIQHCLIKHRTRCDICTITAHCLQQVIIHYTGCHGLKQSTWPRTDCSGGCWHLMPLHTRSGASWRRRWWHYIVVCKSLQVDSPTVVMRCRAGQHIMTNLHGTANITFRLRTVETAGKQESFQLPSSFRQPHSVH